MATSRSPPSSKHFATRSSASGKRLPPEIGIQIGGLLGDRWPGELALDARVARADHALAQRPVTQQVIDRRGQIGAELVWVERLERTDVLLFDRHKPARLTADDDLTKTAHRAPDHGRPPCP